MKPSGHLKVLLLKSVAYPALLNTPFWSIKEGSSSNISTSRPRLGGELPLHIPAIWKKEKPWTWLVSADIHRSWFTGGQGPEWEFTAPVLFVVWSSKLSLAHIAIHNSLSAPPPLPATGYESALCNGPGWIWLWGSEEEAAIWTGLRALPSPGPRWHFDPHLVLSFLSLFSYLRFSTGTLWQKKKRKEIHLTWEKQSMHQHTSVGEI